MTRPKLVAFDLDDTLIGSDGKIAPANFCALEQLTAAGVTAAAVTGRTFYEMPAELRFNPLVPYAVYGDGAAAVNAAGETLFSSYYRREKALAVLHLLRQYDTMIEVFYGGRPYAPADKLNRLAYDYYRIEPIYHPVMAASRVPCTDLEALLAGEEKTEMFNIFNMGIGMVLAIDPADVDKTMEALKAAGETCYELGQVEAGEKCAELV